MADGLLIIQPKPGFFGYDMDQEHSDADRQNTREYLGELERMEAIDHATCPTCNTEVHKDDLRKCHSCLNRGCIYCTVTDGYGDAWCDTASDGVLKNSECWQTDNER